MTVTRPDIADRADIEALLRRFYGAAFEDPQIGPFFTEIARIDLETHLPPIADFWEVGVLGEGKYGRNVLKPHAQLNEAKAMTAEHFGRWVQLWWASVDGLYAGPMAERAKAQGERIANAMLRRLSDGSPDSSPLGFIPLSALLLRGSGGSGAPSTAPGTP